MNEQYGPHKSSIGGIDANAMALLAYLASVILSFIPVLSYVAWIAPLVIFFIEKDSNFVKHHAMQAFTIGIVGKALSLILVIVFAIIAAATTGVTLMNPGAGLGTGIVLIGLSTILTGIIAIAILVFQIMAMVKAYQYNAYEIPVIGKLAKKISNMFQK